MNRSRFLFGFLQFIKEKMSESETDSEISYFSDDSEVSYVCENIEVEEGTVVEANAVSQTELDADTYQPYEDEPIATEEWVSEYRQKQETQAEF